jgi:DUF4097 and DUF4098 domain-containing protein YvlB
MRRSGSFSALALLAAALPAVAQTPAGQLVCRNGKCERMIYGTAPAVSRLRVTANGPVTVEAGVGKTFTYTIRATVNMRTEAEARRALQAYAVRVQQQGPWTTMSTPGGVVVTAITIKAPKLAAAVVSTTEGPITASGVDGFLDVDTRAGAISVDRVLGDSKVITGGGNIQIGQVGGALRCSSGGGNITVNRVGGAAILETNGGDIVAHTLGGTVHAQTGGGGVRIGTAKGPVTAVSGGGEIVVEKSGGIVTLRNMAGPVNVGSAAGVRCDSGSGGIRLANITGPMRVATSMGSINASLFGSRIADSYLATGSGDITVLIPSNVGVTIQAQNSMADTVRRIVSDFATIQPRRQGTRVVAEGAINGGGPVLQLSGMGGTIFIKRM